jgi:FKBP-type peptidyl-prolyl cis-trans isomerase (trigger factor)
MAQSYTNLKKLSDKNGEVEFQAEISEEVLEKYVLEELAHVTADFSMPGFRKGKVPQDTVREQVGEMELLETAADGALRDAMQDIVTDEKLDVLGRPQLIVTKLAPKNPLEFKIRYALSPEVSLPDYKKIARTIIEREDTTEVTEKEIDEAIARIQAMMASVEKGGTAKDITAAGEADASADKPAPLTDEMVKKLGPFNTVADFRTELKHNLKQEKSYHDKEVKRDEMIKEIVKNAKVKVPHMIIEQEHYEFMHDRDEQLKRANLPLEEYLKQSGKTAEDLEKEERGIIEEDIKTSLVIQAIRTKEQLTPAERDIQLNIAQLKLRYPDRDEETLRRTAGALLLQEKLFAVLEGTEEKETEKTKEPKAAPEKAE